MIPTPPAAPAAALEAARALLATDRVARLPWLARRAGVDEGALRRAFPTRRVVTAGLGVLELAALEPRRLEGARSYLVHQALLAEVRCALGAREADWRLPERPGEAVPDAEWSSPLGRAAVELDLRYSPGKVVRKVEAYRAGYARQVWATPSPTRRRYLASLLGSGGEVLLLRL